MKHIDQHYKNRINNEVELNIQHDFIHSKDKFGESKISTREIESIFILSEITIIKMNAGFAYIIPKIKIKIKDFCDITGFSTSKIHYHEEWFW